MTDGKMVSPGHAAWTTRARALWGHSSFDRAVHPIKISLIMKSGERVDTAGVQ
jgi:hypothetical protein